MTATGETIATSSAIPPPDQSLPIYDQQEEAETTNYEYDDDTSFEQASVTPQQEVEGQFQYQEVVYRDEHGNIIPEDIVSQIMAESPEQVEFKTIYQTRTQTLQPGEEPPKGAKLVPVERREGEMRVDSEGQVPEAGESEARPYRTG